MIVRVADCRSQHSYVRELREGAPDLRVARAHEFHGDLVEGERARGRQLVAERSQITNLNQEVLRDLALDVEIESLHVAIGAVRLEELHRHVGTLTGRHRSEAWGEIGLGGRG